MKQITNEHDVNFRKIKCWKGCNLKPMSSVEFIVEGVLLCVVGCAGVLANLAAIIYFSRQKHHIVQLEVQA